MKLAFAFLVALFGVASIGASPINDVNELRQFFDELLDNFENDQAIDAGSSDINDDLQEFMNLLPQGKIKKIAIKHYLFDSEFKKAYKYLCSEEFFKLIRILHKIPAYNEWLQALNDIGLDTKTAISKVHEAIGFKEFRMNDIPEIYERTVASFVAEIKAVLPFKEIKALYKKKLETSESFVQFVELISSKQFQDITNALFADSDFVNFLHKLQVYHINLQVVADFFLTVFGITTPPGVIDY